MLKTIPYFKLYNNVNIDIVINIKLPKNVLKSKIKKSGIKYKTVHNILI